nr:tRNA lysidine(34) synthetase TilS [Granulicella tundricola]
MALPSVGLKVGERVCCAVSGGADSVAMLLLVCAANGGSKGLGLGVSAVHVNHGLRGAESDGDEGFVAALCEGLGVPLTIERADVAGRVAARGETVEEAAREVRYECFRRLIAEGRANVVLTAHTLDDQAETVLMKLLRGAWTEGLGGISPVVEVPGGRVVRPVLGVRRGELVEFLKAKGQGWREDSSNADEAFTRNRLRHTVMPVLRAENPSVDRTLANLAEVAREEEARWGVELKRLLPQVLLPGKPVRGGGRANSTAVDGGAVAIEIERLRAMDGALRRRVLRAAARGIGARLSFDETGRLLALAGIGPADPTVPTKAGSVLKLANGLVGERSVRELRLSRAGSGSQG